MKRILRTGLIFTASALVLSAIARRLLMRSAMSAQPSTNGSSVAIQPIPPSKRAFDIIVSGILLVGLSPILATLAAIIKLTSPGPIFYKATRVGRNGQLFKVYKFRSMVVGADKKGPGITTAGDARVTPIGKILRKYKLDELPQLLNVMKGDMSLVGPRPEDPRYVAMYTPEQRLVLQVAPGITSPASVYYRDEESLLNGQDWETTYIQQIMPAKLAIDMEYARHANIGQDMTIIWKTFQAMWQPLVDKVRAN
jgi:lipopolysaccharide/colanic/teichoic acid biosynthesis glycosyltransferase